MNAKAKDTVITKDEMVTVVLRHKSNLLPALYPNAPDKITYTGKVVGRAEYDAKDSIRITGDLSMPIRVLQFKDIITWNGKPFHYTPTEVAPKVVPPKPVVVEVAGSKGNVYKITIKPDGSKSCSCPGFGFRSHCKHIDAYNAEHTKL